MIQIKHRETGEVLAELESTAGADLSWTNLRWGDMRGLNLTGADMRGVSMIGAELAGANLSEADMRKADMRGADLTGAILARADMRGADLRGAELARADMSDATLHRAIGDGKSINTIIADGWTATWSGSTLSIGCEQYDISEWLAMSDEDIVAIRGDIRLWHKWKPIFTALITGSDQ